MHKSRLFVKIWQNLHYFSAAFHVPQQSMKILNKQDQ